MKKTHWRIPLNLDLTSLLKNNPPSFSYKIDHFYFIIDYLGRGLEFSELEEDNGYISMNAQMLQGYNKNYLKYLQYLEAGNVISNRRHYAVGKKSRSYKLRSQYLSSPVDIQITDFTLKQKINRDISAQIKANSKVLKNYKYLTQWFNDKLKIDYSGAIQEAYKIFPKQKQGSGLAGVVPRKNPIKRYKALMSIEAFSRGEFYCSVDSNIGRFHSNLTNIKKELRRFITYDGKTLVNLDIKNAQPLFSGLLLKSDFYQGKRPQRLNISHYPSLLNHITPNQYSNINSYLLSFIMLVHSPTSQYYKGFPNYLKLIQSGRFYRNCFNILFPNQPFDMKKIKTAMFMIFFSKNQFISQKSAAPKRAFKAAFPAVYEVFKRLKKHNHVVLSHLLQRTETKLVIETIARRISNEKPELPIFTIHDSVVTLHGVESYVVDIMKKEILRMTGLKAKIGVEVWK